MPFQLAAHHYPCKRVRPTNSTRLRVSVTWLLLFMCVWKSQCYPEGNSRCILPIYSGPQSWVRRFIYIPLWDGEGCGPINACCQLNNPPWFCTPLPQPTTDDIELRLCAWWPILGWRRHLCPICGYSCHVNNKQLGHWLHSCHTISCS